MIQKNETVNPDESPIYQYLFRYCRGKVKAIKADALARQFNTTRRDINDEIRRLRRSGAMIGSSRQEPFGYFVPNCREEAREFMVAYHNEVYDMLVTYNRMKRTQRNYLDEKKQESFNFKLPVEQQEREQVQLPPAYLTTEPNKQLAFI